MAMLDSHMSAAFFSVSGFASCVAGPSLHRVRFLPTFQMLALQIMSTFPSHHLKLRIKTANPFKDRLSIKG